MEEGDLGNISELLLISCNPCTHSRLDRTACYCYCLLLPRHGTQGTSQRSKTSKSTGQCWHIFSTSTEIANIELRLIVLYIIIIQCSGVFRRCQIPEQKEFNTLYDPYEVVGQDPANMCCHCPPQPRVVLASWGQGSVTSLPVSRAGHCMTNVTSRTQHSQSSPRSQPSMCRKYGKI